VFICFLWILSHDLFYNVKPAFHPSEVGKSSTGLHGWG